jgi:hypothetical protein
LYVAAISTPRMSDNCLHIIPRHSGEYPQAEKKANEILSWFQDRDIVEKEPSACVLSMGRKGYRFTPNIATIFNDGDLGLTGEI